MSHNHPIYDDDKRFVIDTQKRLVVATEKDIPALFQYDHNSEYITFVCDRFVEGHDLSLCDKAEIHYNNTASGGRYITKGVYLIEDLKIDDNDKSKIVFTWIVSSNATKYAGSLNFIVAFTCTDEGDVLYRWNTGINSFLSISPSINNGEAVEQAYADVLEAWRQLLFGIADTEEARIRAMGDSVIAKIPQEYTELTSDIFQSELFVRSEEHLDDLNNAVPNRVYTISLYDSATVLNMPGSERHGDLLTFQVKNMSGGHMQLFLSTSGRLYMRICWGGTPTWQPWRKYAYYGEDLSYSDVPLVTINKDPGLLSCFLNVGCIGDSLASGESVYRNGSTVGYADIYEHSWGQYLARMTGNTYYNWSSGGRTCATWLSSSYATECFDGNHKCQAYIIGLGQNDYNQNYTIGTSADIDTSDYSNNADSYYGNYGKIIQRIKALQPKAKIFILTDPSENTETGGYNAAVRTIATMFSNVYLVDLYTYGKQLYTTGIIKACNRNGHYNAMAYREMALIIATYIDWIMRNNVSEFSEVEFIGTDYSYSN